MSIQEARRAAFEEHAKRHFMSVRPGLIVGSYVMERTELAWQSWNAALDSVVVELPGTLTQAQCEWDEGYDAAMDICKAMIDAAGIRVEVKL